MLHTQMYTITVCGYIYIYTHLFIYIYIYIYYYRIVNPSLLSAVAGGMVIELRPKVCMRGGDTFGEDTANLPAKIIPTKIRWPKLSRTFPMGLGIPPLKFKIMPESQRNPEKSRSRSREIHKSRFYHVKSRILVRRLAGGAFGHEYILLLLLSALRIITITLTYYY